MNLQPGAKLIHKPTGRPVELVAIDGETFTVHTLDDIWLHRKTGKPWGGCNWVMEIEGLEQFVEAQSVQTAKQGCEVRED